MSENYFTKVSWMTLLFFGGWSLGLIIDVIVSKLISLEKIQDNSSLIVLVFICHMWFYMSINYIVERNMSCNNDYLNNGAFMKGVFTSQIISFTKYEDIFTKYYRVKN